MDQERKEAQFNVDFLTFPHSQRLNIHIKIIMNSTVRFSSCVPF